MIQTEVLKGVSVINNLFVLDVTIYPRARVHMHMMVTALRSELN